ncbi:cytochrome C [Methylococcus capsulatus]|uniref:cytochrome C n=1 Tax=Methylococcus capsulatus TaxID=414 RepID=UPI001C528104|nr:cytochrome C [Methylococcus capsulatus]QXP88755.1 cytochrome C [Methylococcus capsulatus]QXP94214.1 cytochrome C [Methylococcus capsulatus]UQN11037.1 cytochrome C [Methylococcus capsulatus]
MKGELGRRLRSAAWCLSLFGFLPSAVAAGAVNAFDRTLMHPAIPLVDEDGRHVLESGRPYSVRMSCGNGNGGGCHDYDGMNHAYHFEQGRDETRDDYGARRGLPQLVGPGYFGGFNCMQGNAAAALAKKANTSEAEFGDYGAAGYVKACSTCHLGGGWEESDRGGVRYDQMPAGSVPAWDGDYYDRNGDGQVVPWDWRKSGVREADCLTCHADFSLLKKFSASGLGGNGDGTAGAQDHWGLLQDGKFVAQGFFRYANSAMFEFLDVRPDLSGGAQLLTVARAVKPGTAKPDYDLVLGDSGEPVLHWNRDAFDDSGKVRIPMRRFPGNDNCMLCHLAGAGINRINAKVKSSRRGFYGFGEEAAQTLGEDGKPVDDYKDDVHKGKSWTDDTGETRIIDNCNACHAKQYYKPAYANIDLDADHDFPKGNGDADIRNDLDYQPGPADCEYCHSTAKAPALPSGQPTLLDAHRERWKSSGFMRGYATNSYNRVVQVHFDDLACQACHNHKAVYNGKTLPMHYRYRARADGALRVIPYVPNARFFVQDRSSGRVLYRYERQSVFRLKNGGQAAIVDPASGQETGSVTVTAGQFDLPATYNDFKALKQAYDNLLKGKGYSSADVRFVYAESNEYIFTHQTRPAEQAVACEECHTRRADGSINGAVAANGLMGANRVIEVARIPDARLVDEGVVELASGYHKVQADGRITETVAEVLEATDKAPDMSILKAATGRAVGGPLRKLPASEAAALAALDQDATGKLTAGWDSGLSLTFSARVGHPSVEGAALFIPGSPLNQLLLEGVRVELSSRESTAAERRKVGKLGTGTLAPDVYGLSLTRSGGSGVKNFGGGEGWIKLPYWGAATRIKGVKVVYSEDGKTWRTLARHRIVAFKAASGGAAGYVLLRLKRPVAYLAFAGKAGSKS